MASDPEIASHLDAEAIADAFDLDDALRHVDVLFERLGGSPSERASERRKPFMPEAVHVGSGKVREIYELDEDRLLLVASDRISTFDVVLPTEIPDKGRVLTGPLGLLVRTHARDRAEPPARPSGTTGARPRRDV